VLRLVKRAVPHTERFLRLGEVVPQRILRDHEQGLTGIAETAEGLDVKRRVAEQDHALTSTSFRGTRCAEVSRARDLHRVRCPVEVTNIQTANFRRR